MSNSRDSNASDGWIELCELAKDDTESREAKVNEPGCDTASFVVANGPIHPGSS